MQVVYLFYSYLKWCHVRNEQSWHDVYSHWFTAKLKRSKLRHDWVVISHTWWRHQMVTFSALLAFCEGNSPVTGEYPSQRSRFGIFDFFFGLCLNKRLNEHSEHQWFETSSQPIWRHCSDIYGMYTSTEKSELNCIVKTLKHEGWKMPYRKNQIKTQHLKAPHLLSSWY